jgi:hypothetical protein
MQQLAGIYSEHNSVIHIILLSLYITKPVSRHIGRTVLSIIRSPSVTEYLNSARSKVLKVAVPRRTIFCCVTRSPKSL